MSNFLTHNARHSHFRAWERCAGDREMGGEDLGRLCGAWCTDVGTLNRVFCCVPLMR
ncbi:hypothetical protein LPU83_pLPU83b_0049 (plasmid) [Rhizobium favelukesii]|uniref:Uncharacterized protein n=1 Tax=Rhizobium favelukesii TaxID=348824 RepID=W6RGW2_9HYPH|nr:hypothetical protein LPU83_pLPU83b_0049 [Rhizobium favelukesii]